MSLDIPWNDLLFLSVLLIALGGVAGFVAGLLGVGGGIILVPGLYYSFTSLGYNPETMMHIAIGTSLAIIVPTGFASAWTHWKKGHVDRNLVRSIGAGIIFGVGVGSYLAGYLSTYHLKLIFACAILCFAFLIQCDPQKMRWRDTMPRQPGPFAGGIGIGALSTLMGIGGGTMNVPFMTMHGVPIHRAIGSAAAMGLCIAIPGSVGFMLIGWNIDALPPLSIGYVNLLALGVIAPISVSFAPLGAKVAHRCSGQLLRRFFAGFMVIIAGKMLLEIITFSL